jgi:NosR/NirI family transcriptional regulator, nitrous oxide reductase regulator
MTGQNRSFNVGTRIAVALTRCWLVMLCLGLGPLAQADPRFPPPDFETDYQIPEERHPAARALWVEYVDVAVLVIALGLAAWFVVRKRSRRAVLGLSLFSLLYFGFFKAGCVCAIGSVQNVALALFDTTYALPLTVLVFFVAPLAVALFYGRVFCAAVCPHGALQDLVLVKPVVVPRWLEQGLGVIPYLYLGLGVWFAATGGAFVICRLDPFIGIFRLSGSLTMLLVGALFVVTGLFVGRPYCRFLCPFGVLLKLAAKLSRWRVRITPDICTQCQLCEHSCPFGAIREPVTARRDARELARERWRFVGLLALIPVLMLSAGWLGARFSGIAAQFHPDVELAELYLRRQTDPAPAPLPAVDALAYSRAERDAENVLELAIATRRKFTRGGWIFGAFAGLIIGAKLARFSVQPRRTDFEPDRGACYACARCFEYCPQERLRLGTWPVGEPIPGTAGQAETAGLSRKGAA